MEPFARTIDRGKESTLLSSTLDRVDSERRSSCAGIWGRPFSSSKRESGKGLFVGRRASSLRVAVAELGLIDEYEFVVQPSLAGHGPTLFAGLSKRIDLKLVSRLEFSSGAVALRYEPGK